MTLRRDTRGATALEFALIGSALIMLTFGIIEAALLTWTRNGLASIAAATARCTAAGIDQGTGSCTTVTNAQTYAVTAANQLMLPGMITTANVNVTPSAASCNAYSYTGGTFAIVSISSSYFAFMPPPLSNYTLTVSACYPM